MIWRAVRAPVGVAHDGVGAVAHEEPRGAARARQEEEGLRPALVGEEGERSGRPRTRPPGIRWPRSCARAAPRHPPRALPRSASGRCGRWRRARARPSCVKRGSMSWAGSSVSRRATPPVAAISVEVLVAADHLVEDERPGPLPRCAARRRLRDRGERAPAAPAVRRARMTARRSRPRGARLSARPPRPPPVPACPWPARPASC